MYRRIAVLACVLALTGASPLALAAEEGPVSHGTAQAAAPAAAPAGPSLGLPSTGVEVSIRFYDKRLYYPESEIPVKVTISNKTSATWRFKLAEDRLYSLAFEARTPSNRALDPADVYKKALATTRPVFYREMAIEPGEEYSFVENLVRYVHLTDSGSYNLRVSFYPELVPAAPGARPQALPPIVSNVLILSVLPSLGLPPASELASLETGEILRPQAIPPDEVVERTIVARQKARWNEFFLYLDLEALLRRDEARKRSFDRESDEGRRRMVERYKADLQSTVVDTDIVTVPSSFEIIETRYSANTGLVRVIEKFDYRSFKMVKEYDYDLVRRDNIWYIQGYSVLNKGTE